MKLKIYAVYDSAVGAYMQPFFMQSKGVALRSWLEAANDEKTQFNKHPADFTLFELGEYDELSGTFENHPAKLNLGTALEHRSKSQAEPPAFPYLKENEYVSKKIQKEIERTTQ